MYGDGLSREELSEILDELASGLKDLYGERYRGLWCFMALTPEGRLTRAATWMCYFCWKGL